MRLRNIPGAEVVISQSPYAIENPKSNKGSWNNEFKNDNPIYIEIGMGKGRFIIEQAIQNPDINFIGFEKYSSVLIRAVQKLEGQEFLSNLRLCCFNAEELEEVFAKGEIDKIYLNFSDPWPKDRHAKRRLTSRNFLSRYEKLLSAKGDLEFKTDNKDLFEFSLEEIQDTSWILDKKTYDLHNDSEMCANNIMTEYEERFSSMGNPIYKLIAHFENE